MKFIAAIAVFVFMAGVAHAETLVMAPYPAATPWKMITDHHDAKMVWREWIPADQTEADIHDILTEQIFYVQKGRNPTDFLHDLFARVRNACTGASINGPNTRSENGNAVSYGQVYCVGAGGKDVDIFAKAIAGRDALYVIQREFRRPAQPGAVAGARSFSKDQKDVAMASFAAQKVANDYLVSQIKLSADSTKADAPTSSAAAPAGGNNDLSASFGFEARKTTQEQVEDKMGRPTMQNRNADGRHVDLYRLKGGTLVATFLFGKDNVLIRTAGFAHQ